MLLPVVLHHYFSQINGMTTHSRFKIPLNINEDSTCNIKQGRGVCGSIWFGFGDKPQPNQTNRFTCNIINWFYFFIGTEPILFDLVWFCCSIFKQEKKNYKSRTVFMSRKYLVTQIRIH